MVPSDPFVRTVHPEKLLPCTHANITHLNLSAWKEPDTGRKNKTACALRFTIPDIQSYTHTVTVYFVYFIDHNTNFVFNELSVFHWPSLSL